MNNLPHYHQMRRAGKLKVKKKEERKDSATLCIYGTWIRTQIKKIKRPHSPHQRIIMSHGSENSCFHTILPINKLVVRGLILYKKYKFKF